jgi:polysaccharide biosynthesis protein VpsM
MRQLTGICLVILIVLFSVVVKAAEPQPVKPGIPQAEDETVAEKKLPEKSLELIPEYGPGGTPYGDYSGTSLGVGPQTGPLAPYGNSAAMDTLLRGWQTHRLGALRVSPYLEYDALYRTNVFQTYSNKKSDFVSTINPGLRFELPVAETHKLSLGYLGNYFIYSRYTAVSHYDQNVNADASFNFSKLSLRVGSTYRNATEEPTLVQTGPIVTQDRKRPYTLISPYVTSSYNMADVWRVEANYQFNSLNYKKAIDNVDNSQINTVGATVFYKFWPKTSALFQYIVDFRHHPYDQTKDNLVQTPMVGLTWDATAKLSGTVKIGYTITSYYHSNVGGKNFSQGFNPNGLALSIQTLYKFGPFTQMSLVAQRSLQEDPNSGNDAYFNTGLLFTVSHLWHYFKVTTYLSASYYNNNFIYDNFNPGTTEVKRRIDNIIYVGGGLSREITRWLKLRLDYVYFNRGSSFNSYTTNEHKVIVGIQSSF